MSSVLFAALALSAPPVAADLVLTNGKVWTGDPQRPEAEAVAVWHDRVLAVGTTADLKPLVGPRTKVLDLGGRRVVPGFIDSHAHVLGGGVQLSRVELKDAPDEAEFGKRLNTYAATLGRDRWVLGGNWDHDRTFAGKLPSATLVDKYVADRPVFIRRYDGHLGLVNSAALKIAGITAATKDPDGGKIHRGPDGAPTGVLEDNAMDLVEKHVPVSDDAEILSAVKAALAALAENGVTSVQDMDGSSPEVRTKYFRVLQRMAKDGKLTCRIDVRWPIALNQQLGNLGFEADFGGPFVRVGGVKGYLDGSLGASSARFFADYSHLPGVKGLFVTRPNSMRGYVKAADAASLSIAVHAIGDEANATLLDIFEETAKANGPRDRRFRVEHVQHLRPQDYPRFKQLGVVASMQPYHVIDDGRWAEGRIGKDRCASSYAFRSLLDAGAVLAFGSDWPVAPLDVLAGIDAAVTRRTLDGKHPGGWFPEQRITVAEAVAAYTRGSAYGAHQDAEKGTLAAGKFADLVVLSRDVFDETERDKIAAAKVDVTVVGGRIVYSRK